MTGLKVLICGAGITGNALAFWLSKMGHHVTVIERHSTLRATGLQVDLREPGITVLRRMGLEQQFRARSVREQGMEIVDHAGKRKAYFAANRSGLGMQSFTTDYEIMRGDLCRLLYDATKDCATFVFGTTIESFTQRESHVDVQFSDGNHDWFDLLVGADGQGSRTRKLILGPEPDPFHPLGVHIGYFTVPRKIQPGEEYNAAIYIAPGRRFIFTRRHSPHFIQVYLACKTDSDRLVKARGNTEEEKDGLAEIFRGAGWQTDRILKELQSADDFYCERLGVVRMDSWSAGRVALIGDAAYCPSATTGMGTTSGLVGAYILAGEISNLCQGDLESRDRLLLALKAYDDTYRPFISQVQKGIEKGSTFWDYTPSSSWGITIFHILLWVTAFLRLDILSQWFIREDTTWALPDYKQMEQS
ncbi:monooxygenase [Aspergillus arachidicola]|uniref:Monooxygenase n=1 Tax=Aspergillus arachidicola TaxID=656916 RepID=A0A2G7FKZ1_9EURO|nr:monooxygenase [Aspergillus arachidicola]